MTSYEAKVIDQYGNTYTTYVGAVNALTAKRKLTREGFCVLSIGAMQ